MRWTKKEKPVHGNERLVTRFAFIPTLMSDCETIVWLERYLCRQWYDGDTELWLTGEREVKPYRKPHLGCGM